MQPASSATRIYKTGEWMVHEWAEASSTNDLARHLPPWSVARCDVQHAGRGRFNRPWIGAKGGLWNSFTVPLDANVSSAVNWGHLPLVAGLALLDMLREYGMEEARLRWPNDVLIGNAKLAGILVERPSGHMAVIGIGINVSNNMDELAGVVKDPPAALKQHLDPCPDVHAVLEQLARRLATRFRQFSTGGLAAIFLDLKSCWKEEKEVTIMTDEADYIGIFTGIDKDGNPLIREKNTAQITIPAHLVNRLVEN